MLGRRRGERGREQEKKAHLAHVGLKVQGVAEQGERFRHKAVAQQSTADRFHCVGLWAGGAVHLGSTGAIEKEEG